MYLIYRFKRNQDPGKISQVLWRQKIGHRIVSRDGFEELWIQDVRYKPIVEQMLQIYNGDPRHLEAIPVRQSTSIGGKLLQNGLLYPATWILLIASLLVAMVTQLGSNVQWLSYFTISPFEFVGDGVHFYSSQGILASGEYWRFFTPALVHFSVMHLVFNAIWVWDIGRRLEKLTGSLIWAMGVIVLALVSNVLQFWESGSPLFGGLSGVVFGLIGFAWLMPILNKSWPVMISRALMTFFVIWLLLGYSSVPESIGFGKMANTAHAVGLLGGLALALLYHLTTAVLLKRSK